MSGVAGIVRHVVVDVDPDVDAVESAVDVGGRAGTRLSDDIDVVAALFPAEQVAATVAGVLGMRRAEVLHAFAAGATVSQLAAGRGRAPGEVEAALLSDAGVRLVEAVVRGQLGLHAAAHVHHGLPEQVALVVAGQVPRARDGGGS